MAGIFINYRRDDTEAHAGRLYDSLRQSLPDTQLFMDVDSLKGGEDFVDALNRTVSSADLMLVLIGKGWLTITDTDGRRRLDDPNDFVRVEIATALERRLHVLPVLFQGATMPPAQALPEPLQELARRQAIELRHGRWNDDVARLMDRIEDLVVARHPGPRARMQRFLRRHQLLRTSVRLLSALLATVLTLILAYLAYQYIANAGAREVDGWLAQVRYENPEEQVSTALIGLREAVLRANDPRISDRAVAGLRSVVLTKDDKTNKGRRIRKSSMELIKTLRNGNLTLDFKANDLLASDLVDVNLARTNFRGVSLEDAFLLRTDLSGSDLTGSNLNGAYVRNADFAGVTLTGVDVSTVDWFNADGFSLSQLRGVALSTLDGCPKNAAGLTTTEAFRERLDHDYGFAWDDLYGPDKTELTNFWSRYTAPGGLCEQVATLLAK